MSQSLFQSATCRHAFSRIWAPSRRIKPDSSASGMNSAGVTLPKTGWLHRANASKPEISPPSTVRIGWKATSNPTLPQAGAEVGLHLPMVIHLDAQASIEKLDTVFPKLFGAIHGVIRGAQQIVCCFARGGKHHPDTGRTQQRMPLQRIRRPQRLEQSFADGAGRSGIGCRGKQDEFIAAVPADHGAGRCRGPQPGRHRDQQLITKRVTQAVVDCLEPIKVDEDENRAVWAIGRMF